MNAELFVSLAVALGVGFLIGLQREQSASVEGAAGRAQPGGVRTFPLVALAGAVAGLLGTRFGAWFVGAGFAGILLPIGLGYADDLRQGRDRGITSEVSLMLTYFLGCLATAPGLAGTPSERLLLCASLGVAVTALLSFKEPLHALAARVSKDDLYATVKFGILALVALPLLPDRDYGPYQVLNPFHIGVVVVLLAGISYSGYLAVRILGPGKGLGVTGLLGGLVSSTAITLSFSGRAKREPAAAQACALGIILASTVMGARVIALVAVTNRGLVPRVAVPMGALTLAGLFAAAVLYLRTRRGGMEAESVRFSNPFEISSALKFGFLITVVLLVSKAATAWWGHRGTYLAALLAGLTDVDAITISVSRLAPASLSPREAATAVFLAVASNTVVKAGMAIALGGWRFGWRIGATFLGTLAAGGAGAALMALWS